MIPPELLLLALLFAVNRLVLPRVLNIGLVFWTINGLDVAAAVWIYARGFPGMEQYLAVRLLIGTLLLFHVAQNLALRNRARVIAELGPALRRERLLAARSHLPDPPGASPPGPAAPDSDPADTDP